MYLLTATALLLFAVPFSVTSPMQGWARSHASPLTRPLHTSISRVRNITLNIRQLPQLLRDRSALQNQVVALEQQALDRDALAQENQSLRKELGVTGVTKQQRKVLAHVLTEGSDPSDRLLSLDVGTSQEVGIGQPVTVEGALVGRIVQVSVNSAVVRPITSKKSAIQASVAGQNGLLSGDGATSFIIDIPQGVELTQHAAVQSSGLGGSLPAGILIGTTEEILSKPSDVTQRFMVSLPYSGRPLTVVMVLLGS